MFSCGFCEISKNTFFYKTPPDDCFWNSNLIHFLKRNSEKLSQGFWSENNPEILYHFWHGTLKILCVKSDKDFF